ncbi:hypothetical protein NFHkm12_04460 [Latilactobacillus curvatus]|nr:hypothetical protein NFHkm12_04460 [Latilactobacillus curvatus]
MLKVNKTVIMEIKKEGIPQKMNCLTLGCLRFTNINIKIAMPKMIALGLIR